MDYVRNGLMFWKAKNKGYLDVYLKQSNFLHAFSRMTNKKTRLPHYEIRVKLNKGIFLVHKKVWSRKIVLLTYEGSIMTPITHV